MRRTPLICAPADTCSHSAVHSTTAALESQLAAGQTTTSLRPTPASQAQAFDLLPVLTEHKAPTLVSSIQSALSPLSGQESATLLYYLVQGSFGHQYLGPLENLDWRLAQGRMAELLTIHLLDGELATRAAPATLSGRAAS